MTHLFIVCDFEMWNDKHFCYEVLKRFFSLNNEVRYYEETGNVYTLNRIV